jgi:hypothetical protein
MFVKSYKSIDLGVTNGILLLSYRYKLKNK